MNHWTKVLTDKEKTHLRQWVTVLTGMTSKQVVIEELKKSRGCYECKMILDKLEVK